VCGPHSTCKVDSCKLATGITVPPGRGTLLVNARTSDHVEEYNND
jgi:hypothetical protein